MSEEKTLWKGCSSSLINLGTFVVCGLIGLVLVLVSILLWWVLVSLLIVPAAIALWKWVENRCRVYEITSQRIKVATGIITRRTDELELYRVKDMTVLEPIWMRTLGLGNLVLVTNDASTPTLTLAAVPRVNALREELRNSVETCRAQNKVRVAELE